jgi:hypothetical protein
MLWGRLQVSFSGAEILCLLFGLTDHGERFYANQYNNPTVVAAAEIIKAALRIAR